MKTVPHICTIVVALGALTTGGGFAGEASASHAAHHAAGAIDAQKTGRAPVVHHQHSSKPVAPGLTMGLRRGQLARYPATGESIMSPQGAIGHRGANAPVIGGLTPLGARRSTAMISGTNMKRKP